MYGTSEKGWIITDLFESWFLELFLPSAVSARPLLLLLDGHSTHYQLKVIKKARENDVLILCLPPHTTHATQPLDCGVFSPLKSQWSATCHEFFQKNLGKVITKFNFNQLFSQAWLKSLTPANLIAGFKVCDIHPFNRNALKAVPTHEINASEQTTAGIEKTTTGRTLLTLEHEVPTNTSKELVTNAEEDSEIFSADQQQLYMRRFEEGYDLSIDPVDGSINTILNR